MRPWKKWNIFSFLLVLSIWISTLGVWISSFLVSFRPFASRDVLKSRRISNLLGSSNKKLTETQTLRDSSSSQSPERDPLDQKERMVPMNEVLYVDDHPEAGFKSLPPFLKFSLYKELFPSVHSVAFVSPSQKVKWISQMMNQFDLSLCDQNFLSFITLFKAEVLKLSHKLPQTNFPAQSTYKFYYEFDKLTYTSTMESSCFLTGGGYLSGINIRLSNHGFLYPSHANLSLKSRIPVANHNRADWYMLHTSILSKFPSVVGFVKEFLNISGDPQCQFFYHDEDQRMDLKFRSPPGSLSLFLLIFFIFSSSLVFRKPISMRISGNSGVNTG